MKIKAVCEETGLTDRTIRYYIEEGLISPQYTENYLGRKTFNFTQENIVELKNIAILRSFNFSVEEIRSLIQDSASSAAVIDEVKRRTQEAVTDGENKLSVLMQLDTNIAYSVADLAQEISRIMTCTVSCNESIQIPWNMRIRSFVKKLSILLAVWVPILSIIFFIDYSNSCYRYDVYSWPLLVALVCLIPSALLILGAGSRFWKRKAIKIVLLCLCIILCPVGSICALFSVSHSETTGLYDYRSIESRCTANWDLLFLELFPIVHDIPDQYYYYFQDFLDESFQIYAQWEMDEEEFTSEIIRATAVFEKNLPDETEKTAGALFWQEQKGNYMCMILYKPGICLPIADTDGKYYVFAYNTTDNTVRYIHCNNFDQWYEKLDFLDW